MGVLHLDCTEMNNGRLQAQLTVANTRIAELEAALTDALYAWGLGSQIIVLYVSHWHSIADKQNYEEAQERIQKARLALPKAQEVTQ